MNARTRLKRAVLRDRRRNDGRPAIIGPLTGWEVYLARAYAPVYARMMGIPDPGHTPESVAAAMASSDAETASMVYGIFHTEAGA
jgi:hypothetical protein